jgi:hypothetical protein
LAFDKSFRAGVSLVHGRDLAEEDFDAAEPLLNNIGRRP